MHQSEFTGGPAPASFSGQLSQKCLLLIVFVVIHSLDFTCPWVWPAVMALVGSLSPLREQGFKRLTLWSGRRGANHLFSSALGPGG